MDFRDNNDFKDKAPYNFCDYHCDYCGKKDKCAVYQKEMERSLKHILNGDDPANINIIYNDMKEDFKEISDNLKDKILKLGMRFEARAANESEIEEDAEFEDDYIREHPLYESVQKLYDEVQQFLACFYQSPIQGDHANEFFEDLSWHQTLILAKIYRLLSVNFLWDDDDGLDKIVYEESILTLEVIKKSIDIMKNSLQKLDELKEEARNDITHIKANIDDVEKKLDNLDISED